MRLWELKAKIMALTNNPYVEVRIANGDRSHPIGEVRIDQDGIVQLIADWGPSEA